MLSLMPRPPYSQRVVADIIIRAREPGADDLRDPVQFQMPEAVYQRLQAEARRKGSDINALVRDIICAALTERAEAIRRINAARDEQTGG